jgi:hypothetical protein
MNLRNVQIYVHKYVTKKYLELLLDKIQKPKSPIIVFD